MKAITKLTYSDDVSMVTIYNIPDNIDSLSAVFSKIADAGIVVDMICKNPGQKNTTQVSFSVSGCDFAKVIRVMAGLKKEFLGLTTAVNGANTKICVYGEAMEYKCGVAAEVLEVLKGGGVEVLMITTSSVDISLLIKDKDADTAIELLKSKYEL